ncbi:DUF4416 family protein [bacterium]|nr:DUF4416 family protein [bacterium]
MAGIREAQFVKAVCAVTWAAAADPAEAESRLVTLLGPVERRSEPYDFGFTAYYEQEMGGGLKKCFLSFAGLIHPKLLPSLKVRTNEMEAELAVDGRRVINLDPGYLTPAKLVMASAKNFSHRIYIGEGIYGDLQLQYRHSRFHPQHWTFPDYQTDAALAFFTAVRDTLQHRDRQ